MPEKTKAKKTEAKRTKAKKSEPERTVAEHSEELQDDQLEAVSGGFKKRPVIDPNRY